ncbi:orotidine-5'-phosphate decarboxylase [Salinibacter altiplanensis]|uniref:orotidine-5'-phosphate decarboxylase n=1 Tax=Salinibacter altiplanensis TaxID=1803181 RepID=UPI000C9F9E00|nr:orotidine-5'-phosphate decarboxylase [Salinibacter altiplanensis]
MSTSFSTRLRRLQSQKDTAVCVGLDPDPARFPPALQDGRLRTDAVRAFCTTIVEATAPYACAFKPNFAFFEALGPAGLTVLDQVVATIPDDCLVLGDAKRGDIGHSARFYAASIYEELGLDACTVSPYLGRDSATPFLEHENTCTFVLARTSNDGAEDLQEACTCNGLPLYRHVAQRVKDWGTGAAGEAGLVVGATAPAALHDLRSLCPSLPFLIPGVGAQGGRPSAVMEAAATEEGPVLVNSSRSILYASEGPDYAAAAAEAARTLRDALNG